MPDNNRPAAKPEPSEAPGEFDFDVPTAENPRLKRRSLKVKPSASTPLTPVSDVPPAARELASEAPALSPESVRPEHQARPEEDDDAEINAEVKFTEPAPSPAKASSTATQPTASTTGYTPRTTSSVPQPTSPHGTRPATLYYSTGQRKDKEEPSSMKTTPTASPTPSSTTPASSIRPAATASSTRPATVVDYRTNVDRQAREQKSIGGVLSIIVYVLIFFFVLAASLSGYGIYAISKQLHQQSLTIDDLDKRYAAQHEALAAQLNTTIDTLTKAQAQIGREQELILQQQEAINKLISANDANATALRQEKQARANETTSLRARLNNLESREQTR